VASAAARPLTRKIDSGTSGWARRCSLTTNAAISTAEPASPPMVRPVPQPTSGVFTSVKISSSMLAVTSTAPTASKPPGTDRPWSAFRIRNAPNSTSAASGRLTKNTHRQPNSWVSSPPKNNPTIEAIPLIPAHTPSALCRSESWKVVVRMDSAAGVIIAAPKPWASRAPTSSPWLSANPQASEEAANSAVPAISSRRRPSRSPARPPSSRNPP
jgi:hypothetical protein